MPTTHPHLDSSLRRDGSLRAEICKGAGALSAEDIKLIAEDQRPRIADSLDLDSASARDCPNANRWDYLLAVPDLSQLVAVEPHPAKDSEIDVVIAKRNQAIQYLSKHLKRGCRVAQWVWVSPGAVSFSRMDRARRRLDQNGIAFVGRILRRFG